MTWMANAGAALSALSSLQQGMSGAAAANANANAAKIEGRIAEAQGQNNAGRIRRQVLNQEGALKAQAGAQGITMDGSPLEVLMANARQGELQAQDEIYSAQLKKYGLDYQRRLYKRQASNSMMQGVLGAGSSLFSFFGNKYGKPSTTLGRPAGVEGPLLPDGTF